MLLLRSSAAMRAVITQYADLVAAAYPGPTAEAYRSLTGDTPWPGDALLWCRVEHGQAIVRDRPPRGVRVGRSGTAERASNRNQSSGGRSALGPHRATPDR